MWRHRHMGHPLAIVTSHLPIVPTGIHGRMMLRSARVKGIAIIRLRPVNQIMCHVLARGWVRWLRYFTEAKAEVKYRASARIRGPKHDTRFEWPVSILIVTRYPFLPFKTHKTSAPNPRLLTIAGAIWFCRYRRCTPSRLWMHAPVAKEHRLMTSLYRFFRSHRQFESSVNASCQRIIMWIIRALIMHID